jgi:hypothetical protein
MWDKFKEVESDPSACIWEIDQVALGIDLQEYLLITFGAF